MYNFFLQKQLENLSADGSNIFVVTCVVYYLQVFFSLQITVISMVKHQ